MIISIIIPVFNVQEYLPKCLDSLYSQINDNMEVILVNDGSTDNSLTICEQYARINNNTIVVDKENGGLSDARNIGTEVASGDYIYYLDSDDWLLPNAISILYDFAIKNNCEIVQGSFYYAYDTYLTKAETRKTNQVLNKEEAMLELIKNDSIKNFAWGKLYRANIVKMYPFPKGKYFEDAYWQHLIVNECSRYGILTTPLYFYRQRVTGISGTFSVRNIDLLKGYEDRLKFVQEHYPAYTKEMITLLWNNAYVMFQIAIRQNNENVMNEYKRYWEYFNREYNEIIDKNLHFNFRYMVVRYVPFLSSALYFAERVLNRFYLIF